MNRFGRRLTLKVVVALALAVMLPVLAPMGAAFAATVSADITDPAYGAKADDGKDDTAAIQKAIDDLKPHGVLLIPPGTFQVSMARGLTISKNYITVIIQGIIKATAKGLDKLAAKDVFKIAGHNCQFIGQGGMLVGDGTVFRGVMPPRKRYAAFINMGGRRDCAVSGLCLRSPPGVHMSVEGAQDCKVVNCTFEGGTKKIADPKLRACSFYMGIVFTGAKGLLIQGNHFKPYKGRAQYQWICCGSRSHSHQVSIIGNRFVAPWDHPIYCSGIHNSVVANNTTRNTIGTAIKLIGNDLVVTGNNVFNARCGAISARGGSRCIIANNLIQNFGHVAIGITPYGGRSHWASKGSSTDNIVDGNIIVGHKGKLKSDIYAALRIMSPEGMVSRCKVTGNIITNAGYPKGRVIWVVAKERSDSVMISGNTMYDCKGIGIQLRNVHSSLIVENIIDCTGKPIDTGKGQNIILRDNITGKKRR